MHRTAFHWAVIQSKLGDSPEAKELAVKISTETRGQAPHSILYIALTPPELRLLTALGLT
jgi:hypothetical protein